MRLLLCIAALAGCKQVFGLEQAVPGELCWEEAQSMFDEDGDEIVDGCDICPAVSDELQLDEDRDGVGDACDPNPADPIDRIAFFDGFALPTLDPRWMSYGSRASWMLADSAVHQVSTAGSGSLILHEVFENPTAEIVISGQQQLDTSMHSIHGMILRIVPGSEAEYPEPSTACISYLEPVTTKRLLVMEDLPAQQIKDQITMPKGERTVIRATSAGVCTGNVDTNARVGTQLTMQLPPLESEVGFRISHTSGTLHSITVYESVP